VQSDPDYTTRNAGRNAAEGLMISPTTQRTSGPADRLRVEVVTSWKRRGFRPLQRSYL